MPVTKINDAMNKSKLKHWYIQYPHNNDCQADNSNTMQMRRTKIAYTMLRYHRVLVESSIDQEAKFNRMMESDSNSKKSGIAWSRNRKDWGRNKVNDPSIQQMF